MTLKPPLQIVVYLMYNIRHLEWRKIANIMSKKKWLDIKNIVNFIYCFPPIYIRGVTNTNEAKYSIENNLILLFIIS
ncbi:hypothetical protein A9G42_11000 [Gilliamella sp. Nev6-6]|nr:hypothetical protein A9G42_11000 [Gilliamella apicola]